GNILANGTADEPIIFTSVRDDVHGGDSNGDVDEELLPTPGAWNALWLKTNESRLDHVEFWYAGNQSSPGNGSWRTSALHVLGDIAPEIRNTSFFDSENQAIYVNAGKPVFENITMQRGGAEAVYLEIAANPSFKNMTAIGNAGDRVTIRTSGATVQDARVWDFGGLPVFLTDDLNLGADSQLTIVPGTVVKLPRGAHFQLLGAAQIVGSSSAPIVFTSIADDSVAGDTNADGASVGTPGGWDAIWINSSNVRMDNVEIRFAGNRSSPGNNSWRTPALHLGSDTAAQLTNIRISDAENAGIYVNSGTASFDNLTVERAGAEAVITELEAQPTWANVTLSSNVANRVTVRTNGKTTAQDLVWDFASMPIHLTDDLNIGADHSLTIAPGSIVKLPNGAHLNATGALIAAGTADKRIVFTSIADDAFGGDTNSNGATDPSPGSWDAIWLNSTNSVLDNVDIRYAGNRSTPGNNSWRTPALHINNNASPLVANVSIEHAENQGLYAATGSPVLQNLSITDSGAEAIILELESYPDFRGVTVDGNLGGDRITLRTNGKTLDDARTWDFEGIPVHFTNDLRLGPNADLTVAAGSIFKLPNGAHLEVDGKLTAIGTETAPIVFTSINDDTIGGDSNGNLDATAPQPGDWNAIWIDSSDVILDHVELYYAGNQSSPGNNSWHTPALHVREDSAPQLKNLGIHEAGQIGLYVGGTSTPLLQNVMIDGSGQEAIFLELEANPTFAGVQVADNRADRITLRTDDRTLDVDRVWDFDAIPVHFTGDLNIGENAHIEVPAGQTFKLPNGGHLAIAGSFHTSGTATQPVIFTSYLDDTAGGDTNADGETNPVPGGWNAIFIDSNDVELNNTEIRYAGNRSNPGNNSWRVPSVQVRGGHLTAQGLTITDAENQSLQVLNGGDATLIDSQILRSGSTAVLVTAGNFQASTTIFESGTTGVRVEATGNATIGGSSFEGFAGQAAVNATNDVAHADFRGNWWGDPLGPNDASNADGVVNDNPNGQAVSDYVDYAGFLNQRPVTAIAPRILDVQPTESNAVVDQITMTVSTDLDLTSISPSDLRIDGQVVSQIVATELLANNQVAITFTPAISTDGTHTISLGPDIRSARSGLALDQDRDNISGEANDDVFNTTVLVDLTGPKIIDRNLADVVTSTFSEVILAFSEEIAAGSLQTTDAELVGPGGAITISSVQRVGVGQVRVRFPAQSAAGDYEFRIGPAITDVLGNPMDQDENGATGEVSDVYTFTVRLQPSDLTPTDLSAPDTIGSGEAISLSWTVQNVGDGTAVASWSDRVYLSADETVSADDIVLGTVRHDQNVAAGENYTATLNAAIPPSLQGSYHLLLVVDWQTQLLETDETNNFRSRPIEVQFQKPTVDLRVNAVVGPDAVQTGATLDVTWRVVNEGRETTTTDRWSDRVWLSTDETRSVDDVLLGTVAHQGLLAVGVSYTETSTFNVPPNLAAGQYYIIVQSDALGQVSEPGGEGNNDGFSTPLDV
ncbi:MAG: hypothetical protein KDB23_19505, partial [Planctomycetales bacterium]|nr:hypothetical protein [Planctomycetales bacterium]